MGGESQATAEMREVGTGVKMGRAVRCCGKKGKSEGIWWMDGKWQ